MDGIAGVVIRSGSECITLHPINKTTAVNFIGTYHYSGKVLPRINKVFIGGFINDELMAVMTLGYGTRPLHTIKILFPTLGVENYFEIGKLCVAEEMPRNTESMFISRCIRYIKEHYPERKILFSWADGIVGKPGYVYQGSNFFYGGKITTEMYIDGAGNRMHPRSFQGISPGRTTRFGSRAYEVTKAAGYTKYFGYQFRYVYPLCNRREWRQLLATSPFTWERQHYPKNTSCEWFKQVEKGKREKCEMPVFLKTEYKKLTKDIMDVFF